MILYVSAGSPFARVIRVLALERGLPVTERETTLRDPAAPMLAVNPAGRVPALWDGASLICETALILAHLGLLPREPAGLARLGRALALLEGIAVWNRELRRPVAERSPNLLALERNRAARILDAIDPAAEDPHDVAGVALACALGYCDRRHTVIDWREGRAPLAAWFEGVAARPAFVATLPPVSALESVRL